MENKRLYISLAFLVRLVLMPITLHRDLLSSYLRSAHILEGTATPDILSAIPHLVQSAWLWCSRPLMPTYEAFFNHTAGTLEGNPEIWATMTSDPYLLWYLFLFKIPYALFEAGILLLLLKMSKEKLINNNYLTLWLLSLPILYATYLFGRYETITLFFLLLIIYYHKREKHLKSVLPLLFLFMTRAYFVIIIPFYLIEILQKKEGLRKLILPATITVLIFILFAHKPLLSVATSRFAGFFYTVFLDSWFFPIYPIIYLLTVVYAIRGNISCIQSSGLAIISFFILCYWHPQYFTWAVPFLIFWIARKKHPVAGMMKINIAYLAVLCIWRFDTTVGIFYPVLSEGARNLALKMEQHSNLFIGIGLMGRLILSALIISLIWNTIKQIVSSKRIGIM